MPLIPVMVNSGIVFLRSRHSRARHSPFDFLALFFSASLRLNLSEQMKKLVKEREISPKEGWGKWQSPSDNGEDRCFMRCCSPARIFFLMYKPETSFYHMNSVSLVIKKSLLFDSRAQYYRKCWVF